MARTVTRLVLLILLAPVIAAIDGSAAFANPPHVVVAGDISVAAVHPGRASPSEVTVTGAAGSSISEAMVITNHSDAEISLVVTPVDSVTAQTSGSVFAAAGVPARQAGTWITPSLPALVLPATSQRTVTFIVAVPVGATAGDHVAGIAVENVVPAGASNGIELRQVLRNVVGIHVVVPGPAAFIPSLKTVAIAQIASTDTGAIDVGLANVGNQIAKPQLTVTLIGPGAYHRRLSRDLDTVLPGDSITYPFAWPDALAKGSYDVTTTLTGGGKTASLHRKVLLGGKLSGVAASTSAATLASNEGLAWWTWLLIGLAAIAIGWATRLAVHRFGGGAGRGTPER